MSGRRGRQPTSPAGSVSEDSERSPGVEAQEDDMAVPSPADEKSHMSFVDDAIDLDCLDWGGGSGPPSSMLQAPAASSSPGSPPKPSPSLRASSYRAFQSSGSLPTGALASGSASSRKLPEIALDLSPPSPSASSRSSPPTGASSASSGHFGTIGGVSLPSPSSSSQQSEGKKKSFLMASLAIGLNEVIPTNDDDDDDDDDTDNEDERSAIQPKASPGRSPKKFQLGLPQKSPSYALVASPKNASPTGGNGSKLLPITLSGGAGGSASGGNSHALLKFDPIMGGASGSSKSLDLEAGAKSPHADPPSSYRKTIASRSPLRDRSILGECNDFASAPSRSSMLSASFSGSSPSKLDPLDTESIRGSSLTPSGGASPGERKSMKLLPSSFEKAQPEQKQQPESKATTTVSSPDKPSAAQPKFRNPFKKNIISASVLKDKSKKGTSAQDDDIDLLVDAHHSSTAQTPVAVLTPMDEFNYLSFSPRSGAMSGKQTTRDLPSLSLSSDAKDSGTSANNSAKQQPPGTSLSPKKTKKPKQAESEQAK